MKKRFTKLASVLVALCLTLGLSAVVTAFAEGEAAPEVTYSAKTAIPEKADFVNFYGGADDLSAEDGDGVFTFAHAGYTVGLEGANIQMNTLFKMLSKKAVAEGGDGIDGWVTYSFSATPADATSDQTYPYYGGSKSGYFLHVTNYSGTTAPNCVEVQVVKSVDGATTPVIGSFFLDNAHNVPLKLSLVKGDDGKYDLSFTKLEDNTNLKTVADLELDESLFINENGQTFFSTAIYEAEGCDGQHWLHRGIAIFSAQVYTVDAAAAEVALETENYEYEEGNTYKPEVTVTLNGAALVEDVDYYVDYADNKAVGTAKAVVTYIGNYTGNAKVEKTFTIAEKTPSEQPGTSEQPGASEPGEELPEDSCSGGISAGIFGAIALMGAAVVALKKRG